MIVRFLNLSLLILCLMFSKIGAQDDLQLTGRGPIHIRNQFPLALQFLSFRSDNAFTLKNNHYRISLDYHHSNTFAQSEDVLKHITDRNHRIALSSELLNQSAGKMGSSNRFLFDSAIGRATIDFQYGISDQITLEIDIPFIAYQGGFLDRPIEIIHKFAGFAYVNRALLNTNTSQFFLSYKQGDLFYNPENLGGPGLGDIILMAKGQIYKSYSNDFALSARMAVKFPTGNYTYLRGSGSYDFGLDLTATKKVGKSFISTNVFGIIPGQWKLLPSLRIKPSYSWILSYEYLWGDKLSLLLQNLVQSSYFEEEMHPEISKTIFEWTAGLKYDIGNKFELSFSVTENYIHHNNTADFSISAGISRRF